MSTYSSIISSYFSFFFSSAFSLSLSPSSSQLPFSLSTFSYLFFSLFFPAFSPSFSSAFSVTTYPQVFLPYLFFSLLSLHFLAPPQRRPVPISCLSSREIVLTTGLTTSYDKTLGRMRASVGSDGRRNSYKCACLTRGYFRPRDPRIITVVRYTDLQYVRGFNNSNNKINGRHVLTIF